MSRWIDGARAYVRELAADIPSDATIPQRRKVFRENGWRFHGNTYWGRKQWGRAVREYLAIHDETKRPLPLEGQGSDLDRLIDRIATGDITFPFRGIA